jgi:hypothetical protein
LQKAISESAFHTLITLVGYAPGEMIWETKMNHSEPFLEVVTGAPNAKQKLHSHANITTCHHSVFRDTASTEDSVTVKSWQKRLISS